jgi:hypothetical protein
VAIVLLRKAMAKIALMDMSACSRCAMQKTVCVVMLHVPLLVTRVILMLQSLGSAFHWHMMFQMLHVLKHIHAERMVSVAEMVHALIKTRCATRRTAP